MLKINKEMFNHFTQSDSNFSRFFAVLRVIDIDNHRARSSIRLL